MGPDGAYFWDEKTGEVSWEVPDDEQEGIIKGITEVQKEKSRAAAAPSGVGSAASAPVPKRGSVVLREKQLEDIRMERLELAQEKEDLERLRAEILQLRAGAVKPSSAAGTRQRDRPPCAPKSRPPSKRRR